MLDYATVKQDAGIGEKLDEGLQVCDVCVDVMILKNEMFITKQK